MVRSPLGSCNRLSAALQQRGAGRSDEAALRRPRRRHSYQEACSGADDDAGEIPVPQRHPRVLLRRLSVDIGRSSAQLSDDVNDDGRKNDDDDMSIDDVGEFKESGLRLSEKDLEDGSAWSDPEPLVDGDGVFRESVLRLSKKDLEDGSDRSKPVQLLGGRIEDDGWETCRYQSVVDLPSLPPDIQCVSA